MSVAQCPGRGPPDGSGDIDYAAVFGLLAEEGYGGILGLQYRGSDIAWLSAHGLAL